MAAKYDHPEKYGWWLNELESLGVSPKVCNELHDMQEVSNLTEILNQTFYQQYNHPSLLRQNQNHLIS
jgi:hypothetical protein